MFCEYIHDVLADMPRLLGKFDEIWLNFAENGILGALWEHCHAGALEVSKYLQYLKMGL